MNSLSSLRSAVLLANAVCPSQGFRRPAGGWQIFTGGKHFIPANPTVTHAFSTRQVAEAFSKTGTVYLKADWTRRDAKIAAELAEYGRAGVPLYLVYGPHGGEPTILPQLLTGPIVARALESAAAR